MITGDLNLTFEDLVLPGSAGMDLRVVRTYSRNRLVATQPGFKWALGFAGIPRRVVHPTPPQSGEDPFPGYPSLEMSDGSSQRLFPTGHWLLSTAYVGSDYSQYDTNTRILTMPNGWTATFEQGNPIGGAALIAVHDPYGNSITPTWGPLPLPANRTSWRIDSVTQIISGQTRTVTVGYPSATQRTVTYNDGVQIRTWTYELNSDFNITSVTPPTGPGWSFDYSNGLKVTTPSGGWVQYTFTEQATSTESPPTSLPVMVVNNRTTGGPSIEPWSGTFTFNFTTRIAQVLAPNNLRLEYRHTWEPYFQNWMFDRKWVFENNVEIMRYEADSMVLGQGGQIVPSEERIVRAGRTYTTSYEYSANDAVHHWGDYGRAKKITEVGDLTRVTTRTFDYNFATQLGNFSQIASTVLEVAGESFTTLFHYEDSTGFLQSKDELGSVTTFGRDSGGNISSSNDALNHQTSAPYQWGVPASAVTPHYTVTREISQDGSVASETRGGVTTGFGYDLSGRPTSKSTPGEATTTTTYAPDGSWMTVSKGATAITTTLDGFGRTIRTEDSVGVKTVVAYDVEGRKCYQSYPFTGSSHVGDAFQHDALGRVTKVTHADSTYVETTYTTVSNGTKATIRDENGRYTEQVWQAFGNPTDVRLVSLKDANNKTWVYSYNALGNLTRVQSPEGPDRVWTYNNKNQLETETQPESGTTTFTYWPDGLLQSKNDALGHITTYSYDGNHRLIGINAPGTADDVTFEYDSDDNRTRALVGGIDSFFAFDADRLVRREDRMDGGHVFISRFEYDTRSNLIKIIYPSGRIVEYEYDAANRVSRVFAGAVNYANGIAYHPSGAIQSFTFGNNLQASIPTFDPRHRPTQITSGPLDVSYTYDNVGNVTSSLDTRPGFSSWYGYDALDRLESISGYGSNAYTYDALGNRKTKASPAVTYQYSASSNRLEAASSASGTPEAGTFGYDAVGNLTSYSHAPAGVTASYSYSPRNAMASATMTTPSGTTATTYGYDADGMRFKKTSSSTTRLFVRGASKEPLAEYTTSGGTPVLARESIYLGSRLLATMDGDPALNQAPTAALTAPAANSSHPAPVTIGLTATASDPDGTVTKVDFYANDVLLGTDTTAPYSFNWSVSTPATYTLTAVAHDNRGARTTSSGVPVTVTGTGPRMNWALGTNGAWVSASTVYPQWDFAPFAAINGERTGHEFGAGGIWHDATWGTFPDWLEVNFNGSKSIDEVSVFSMQDNYAEPAPPTETMTTGAGLRGFEVQYWNGTAWVSIAGASVTNNNLVWKKVTFTPVTTSKIRVLISDTWSGWSAIAEVEAWGVVAPPSQIPRSNWAVSTNGGTATASTIYPQWNFAPAGAINGERSGHPFGSGGIWHDATWGYHPDWLEVTFNGFKDIDEVHVFSMQDNYGEPVDPTPTMTTTAGLRGFEIQYWNGTAWIPIPSASVTGNNLVWRQFTFTAVRTNKIRVSISDTWSGWSAIAEIEAWGLATDLAPGSPPLSAPALFYHHTDLLGSVRATTDATGGTVVRHDYSPFGESTSATSGDPRRFTGKERDPETGFDYFEARCYRNVWGRFTSVDPVFNTQAAPTDAQRWNRYAYALNGPFRFVDPDGREVRVASVEALNRIRDTLPDELKKYVVLVNGRIDPKEMAKAKTDDANFKDLLFLVQHKEVLRVSTDTEARSRSSAGVRYRQELYYDHEGSFRGGVFMSKEQSLHGVAEAVLIARPNLVPPKRERQFTAHEIYGHAVLHFKGQPHSHQSVSANEYIRKVEARIR